MTTGDGTDEILGRLAGAQPPPTVQDRIVRGAMARASTPPRRWRWLAGVPIASATALLVAWVLWVRPTTYQPIEAGFVHQPRAAAAKYAIGPAEIDVSTGAHLRVERATPENVALVLTAGRIAANVRPLAAGRSFEIRSPHGTVRVVGTRFVVEVSDCTYVSVSKGAVLLEGTSEKEAARVSAGQQRALCPHEEPPLADDHGRSWVREAMGLITRGEDPDTATRLLERYLDTYPNGLFAEEATFHLVFLLEGRGHRREAASMARRFLATFPDSRRSAELQRLLEDLQE